MIDLTFSRVKKTIQTPLYRNGYALILSSVSTSGLGLLYWTLAARLYSPETVGVNSALLSAMMFLSGITLFGLNSALVRFLPVAGKRTAGLVVYSYLVCVIFAALVSFGAWFVLRLTSFNQQPGLNTPLWLAGFVIATTAWSIFNLQDSVLTGLRRAVWIPLENGLFAAVKIIFLIAFASYFSAFGVFLSWTLPVLLTLGPVNWLIFRRLMPENAASTIEDTQLLSRKPFLAYIGGNYISSLFFLAYTNLLPILVIQMLGAKANAYFYLPWTLTLALFQVAVNMTTSMTVEVSKDLASLRQVSYQVLSHTLKIIGPVILAILVGADLLLRLFGQAYASQGANLLRLLAVSALPHLVISIFWSRWRVQNNVRAIVITQALLCALILGLSWLLLPLLGILGVGVAWLAAYSVVALLLAVVSRKALFSFRSGAAKGEGV